MKKKNAIKPNAIVDAFKKMRYAQNKTYREVSEATGVPISSLLNYEEYYVKIPLEVAEKLAEYYGYKIIMVRPRKEEK